MRPQKVKFRSIEMDINYLENVEKEGKWNELLDYIKRQTAVTKNGATQALELIACNKPSINYLLQLLKRLNLTCNSDHKSEVICIVLRSLRNISCSEEAQLYVSSPLNLQILHQLFDDALNKGFDELIRVELQLLINLCVNNAICSQRIIQEFQSNLFRFDNDKFLTESTALLYNLSLFVDTFELISFKEVLQLTETRPEIVYPMLCVEKYASQNNFWQAIQQYGINDRTLTLECLKIALKDNQTLKVHSTGVQWLVKEFCDKAEQVFEAKSLTELDDGLKPLEFSLKLDILACLSGRDYLEQIKTSKNVAITSAVLLINLHRLSKATSTVLVQTNCEPALQFKSNLIRILANLAFEDKIFQDLIRETEVIPIILECCVIDDANPFIMQWAIYALRSLCQNNAENQAIIANLKQKEVLTPEILQQMGYELQVDGEKRVKLVSLNELREKIDNLKLQ